MAFENLNINSSNALLKSLEDVMIKIYFYLHIIKSKKILDTINSRCLTYKINFNYLKLRIF